ncbi:MAG: GNAT family N-acetyltransferase [Pelagibacteraceae bacterium]
MLNIVEYKKEHIEQIETAFDFCAVARGKFSNGQDVVGYTLVDDDRIIATAGVHIMWDGVAEGWLVMSKYSPEYGRTVARYAYRGFDSIMRDNGLHRVQASISSLDPEAIRFARWMGFENEGIMEKFGPDGSDYYRMARVM